ncbi:glucose 1-dehydrogenase [Stappia sp. GBMRC 2046]|uniref:Glucose 1-dehydrogenase n=1 Tax=Stappia sediminis TaxID=2692190 RepID=A0A7X3LWH8_9HYPH|nr:SDR family oxidoreductase [Stappia sediminis]MXN66338.1 glucose 1-dehydrogenase [Stappia sediminis]
MPSALFDLSGKVALVTGSTRGIGRAIAEEMAAAGAHVVISSRTVQACEDVAASIRASGGKALPVAANISRDGDIERLVSETEKEWSAPDILVCNAAVNPYYGPFLETPDDVFDKTIAVNIRANMKLAARTFPGMAAKGGGAAVVISSIAAFKGSNMLGLYALTKAADAQLVRNLAVAYGRDNIRVNGIAPAVVRTDFARTLWEDPEREARLVKSYPLGRIGEPEDVAGAAVFLASRAGGWMTGQTLIIDGGWQIADGST